MECQIKSKWAGVCKDGSKAPFPRPPVATPPKKKAASTEGGRKYIARYTCQISSANLAEIP